MFSLTEIVKHARAGESWALLWIGDRYWPKSARLEIADEVSSQYEGPFRGPFMSSEEIEAAMPGESVAVTRS